MMRIRLPVQAALWKHPQKQGDYILLKATCKKDNDLVLQFFRTKTDREKRNQREFFVQVVLDLPHQKRTFQQNAAVWKLVTVIFESMEGRMPDEEEKYNLYLDLLDVYAEKVPNRIKGGLRPIHISEQNSLEGSMFIDGLLYHLATECSLSYEAQTTVQEVLQEWENWRGGMEKDHTDYANTEQTEMLTELEWRRRHAYSEASGRGGAIVRAHIVSRGSDAADIEASWNWIAMLPEEHLDQHWRGWDEFLRIYPHLKGRVERARKLAAPAACMACPPASGCLDLRHFAEMGRPEDDHAAGTSSTWKINELVDAIKKHTKE
jgi:hypothetical protein